MLRFRNGLSGTTTSERLALIYLEQWCRVQAIQLAYLSRLDASGTYIVDADDLQVTSSSVRWARRKGLLYVICKVWVQDTPGPQEFRLKASSRPLAARQMEVWRNLDK
jgi:hypothetical protein